MQHNIQDGKIAKMTFASIYSLHLSKVQRKERTEQELQQVIEWLTGYNTEKQQEMIEAGVSFEEFFENAKIPENANLITGTICGVKIQEVENPLTKKVRYLDKLVDELAKGKEIEKIISF